MKIKNEIVLLTKSLSIIPLTVMEKWVYSQKGRLEPRGATCHSVKAADLWTTQVITANPLVQRMSECLIFAAFWIK
jgi:hypothetical protein